jgi:hypothetical protein
VGDCLPALLNRHCVFLFWRIEMDPICPFCGLLLLNGGSHGDTPITHPFNDCHAQGVTFTIEQWTKRPEIPRNVPLVAAPIDCDLSVGGLKLAIKFLRENKLAILE